MRGDSPVIGARVHVRVAVDVEEGEGEGEGEIISTPIPLYDRGDGDPDLVANDGIYSRYLVSYPVTGRYRFKVTKMENFRTFFLGFLKKINLFGTKIKLLRVLASTL